MTSALSVAAQFAASAPTWLWYLARGSGIVSLLLLTASVLLGILTSVRWWSERWPRFTTTMLHRNVSLLAVVFLVVHIASVVIDGFAPIRWLDAVVPFQSPYRPFWLGFGAIAFDLVLALVATSLLRKQIGPRLWRGVHWVAYACWPVAVVHGMGTGTDTATEVFLVVDALCVASVIVATWWRVRPELVRRQAVRGWVLATTIVAPLLLIGWLLTGPLASRWASRAGTPAALIAGTGATASAGSASPSPSSGNGSGAGGTSLAPTFAASFDGSATASPGPNQSEALHFDAPFTDGSGKLVVDLQGVDDGRGFAVRSGSTTVTSADDQVEFTGTITTINGGILFASPSTVSPTALMLAIRVTRLDSTAGVVSGSVRTTAPSTRGDDG